MEDFYNAMTTYINSKKPKEICYHARTIKKDGWETCVDCRSRLSRIFCDDIYSHLGGYAMNKPKENRLLEIKKIISKMIRTIVVKDRIDVRDLRMDQKTGEIYDAGHPGGDLPPDEIFSYLSELSMACFSLEKKVKCHRRSLCASVLWNKVKPMIKLKEFSEKVGVSIPTIKKALKEMNQHT